MTTDRVAAIVDTEPDPRAETPCPGWNYGQLLGHLVGGDRLFVAIIAGRGVPAQPRLTPDADQPPPTPADYREASGRLASVLQDPEVSAGVYQVPVGRLHGSEIVVLRSVEHLLGSGGCRWCRDRRARSPCDRPGWTGTSTPAGCR